MLPWETSDSSRLVAARYDEDEDDLDDFEEEEEAGRGAGGGRDEEGEGYEDYDDIEDDLDDEDEPRHGRRRQRVGVNLGAGGVTRTAAGRCRFRRAAGPCAGAGSLH